MVQALDTFESPGGRSVPSKAPAPSIPIPEKSWLDRVSLLMNTNDTNGYKWNIRIN